MNSTAIRVEGIWKQYRLGGRLRGYQTARERLMDLGHRALRRRSSQVSAAPESTFWALRDVSFSVNRGDVVGVIGRNGAGKSTLLKVLSRITEPSRGFAEVHGRLSSLLEVGTGFHPELTGRENIFLSAAILGMRRADIIRKFDDIVTFAEVERFVDTPVKHYSSGMYLRLAFSVAAHLDTENLLVDEVLAVGDQQFQKRCLGKMHDVANEGRTVLFVSHNMGAVAGLCKSALLLKGGELQTYGPTADVIERYLREGASASTLGLAERIDREGLGRVRFTGLELRTLDDRLMTQVASGEGVKLVLHLASTDGRPRANLDIAISIRGVLGELLFVCQRSVAGDTTEEVHDGNRVVCTIPRLPLPPGLYYLTLWCASGTTKDDKEDKVENASQLEVVSGDYFGTGRMLADKNRSVLIDNHWAVE